MPTPFKVTVRLNISRELLWRIRASRTFMDFLVANGALTRMDATKTTTAPDAKSNSVKTRRQTYVPASATIPDLVKPLIDDAFIEISDVQTWDESAPYLQRSVIHPTILGDVVTTTAYLSLHEDLSPHGGDPIPQDSDGIHTCLHTLSGDVAVTVPFVGFFVEQAVVSNMKEFYADYPRHVDDFIDMAIRKFGDGSRASLPAAVDRILAQDAKLLS